MWPFVPLEPLLSRSRGVIHAGGFGTTALTASAGLPSAISPCFNDSYWQADRHEALGIGIRIRHRNLGAAVERLVNDDDLHRRAAELGQQVAQEDGTGTVCAVLCDRSGRGGSIRIVPDSSHVPTPSGGWSDQAQVDWYLSRVGRLEARQAGERMLIDVLPPAPRSVLDLGCGDGRLAALVLEARSSVTGVVAVDRSTPMLQQARERFAGDDRLSVIQADLVDSISPFGSFDLIVSGFAIHHLEDVRKRKLFAEVAAQLHDGGRFINLEVVASGSVRWHDEFLAAIGRTADDAEDRLVSVDEQLSWMRAGGLDNCDCLWRWRGFALLVGDRL